MIRSSSFNINKNRSVPVILSREAHIDIFNVIKQCFSYRLHNFDTLVAPKLWQVLADSNSFVITEEITKNAVGKYYDASQFQTNHQKLVLWIVRLIFKATFVLIISYYKENRELIWSSVDRLVAEYGHHEEFRDLDPREKNYLLNFRNAIKIAQLIIPAKNNKGSLLLIAGSLEGSRNEYVTGGKICYPLRMTNDLLHVIA